MKVSKRGEETTSKGDGKTKRTAREKTGLKEEEGTKKEKKPGKGETITEGQEGRPHHH